MIRRWLMNVAPGSRARVGRIEARPDGLRWLVITDGWSDGAADLVRSHQVDGIELNAAKGTWARGAGFLAEVPELRHLILIDLAEHDVSVIAHLPSLLSLSLITYASTPLDFAALPNLTAAAIEWRPTYAGLSECRALGDLSLNRFGAPDLEGLAPLTGIHRLRVGDSRIVSLDGIESLTSLERLELAALPKLTSLAPLAGLPDSLRELTLRQCRRIGAIEALRSLRRLEVVNLEDCGKIASLRPLAALPALRVLLFAGDTWVTDGDLDFLADDRFSAVAFQNRRHYSLRRESLKAFHR